MSSRNILMNSPMFFLKICITSSCGVYSKVNTDQNGCVFFFKKTASFDTLIAGRFDSPPCSLSGEILGSNPYILERI